MSLSPIVSVSVVSALPAWRAALRTGTLYTFPTGTGNSNSIYGKSPFVVGDVRFPGYRQVDRMLAWPSGVYSEYVGTHGAFVFCCGGDGDYWGNEVYVFDLGRETWSRYGPYGVGPPSNVLGITGSVAADVANGIFEIQSGEVVASGQPLPPHNYDSVFFLPPSMGGGSAGSFCFFNKFSVYGPISSKTGHRWDIAQGMSGRALNWERCTPVITQAPLPQGPWIGNGTCAVERTTKKVHGFASSEGAGSNMSLSVIYDFSAGTGVGAQMLQPITSYQTNGGQETSEFWSGPTGSDRYILTLGRGGTPGEGKPEYPGNGYYWNPIKARLYDLNTPTVAPVNLTLTGTLPYHTYGPPVAHCPDLNVGGGGVFFTMGNDITDLPYVYKITPPATNPKTNAWTVSKERMNGTMRAELSQYPATSHPFTTSAWHKRFFYATKAKCLVWMISTDANCRTYAYVPQGL